MTKLLSRLHKDERGIETLQVVMIIAIAAIILAFVKLFWEDVKAWFDELTAIILGWKT